MKTTQAKNDLVLIVINDGDGSQCGMDYAKRCNAAEIGIFDYRMACKRANNWRINRGAPMANHADIIEAANEIQEYYRNHMRESKRLAKQEGTA